MMTKKSLTMLLVLSAATSVACGGAQKNANDPSNAPEGAAQEEGASKPKLEKFKGDRMEKANEEE